MGANHCLKRCAACRIEAPMLDDGNRWACQRCRYHWYAWSYTIRELHAFIDGRRARPFRAAARQARHGLWRKSFKRMCHG